MNLNNHQNIKIEDNLKNIRNLFISNKNIFLSPWLYPNKFHPNNINYNYYNSKINFNKYNSKSSKIFNFIFNSGKMNLRNKNITQKKYLFVSHFINKNHINEDYYFNKIINYQEDKSIILLRNHTNYENNKIEQYFNNSKIPRILMPKGYNFFLKLLFIKELIFTYFIVLSKIIFIKDETQKKILFDFCKLKNISQNILNLQYYSVIKKILNKNNFEKIFFTFEGHTWERYIVNAAKAYNKNIICVGYQFSVIINQKGMLTKSLGNNYDPDIICVSGEFGKKIMKNNFKSQVINIGNRIGEIPSIDFKNKKLNTNCLVMPEGIMSECVLMYDFVYAASIINNKINFIIRFHDQFDTDYFLQNNKKYLSRKNIIFSKSPLKEDFKRSTFCLYRGTSGIFEAMNYGLLPIYLDLISEFNIDPINSFKDNIKYVQEPEDLVNYIIRNLKFEILKEKNIKNKKISNLYFNKFIKENINYIYE